MPLLTRKLELEVAVVNKEAGILCELFPNAAAHINAKNEETGEEDNTVGGGGIWDLVKWWSKKCDGDLAIILLVIWNMIGPNERRVNL